MTNIGEVSHRDKRCIKVPILVKTKGGDTDTLWGALTTLVLALAKLSVYSTGKRKPDRGDPGGFGASSILSCLWTGCCLSSLLALWRSLWRCAWCPLPLTIFIVESFSLTPLYLMYLFCLFV